MIWLSVSGGIALICHNAPTTAAPHTIAVLPDENCEQPCWQGIQPGITDYKDAHNLVATMPNTTPIENDIDAWWYELEDTPPHQIRLVFRKDVQVWIVPQGVRLGDMILALGAPDYQSLQFEIVGRDLQDTHTLNLYYPEIQVIVGIELALGETPTPYTPVTSVRYYPETLIHPFGSRAWTGFAQDIGIGRSS